MRVPTPWAARAAGVLTTAVLLMNPALAQEPAGAPTDEAPAGAEEAAPEAGAAAPAESGSPPMGIEEIVITAEKRETLLQETPMAVSAFDQESYEDLKLDHGTDYTLLVPSLSFRVSPNRLFIRGIGRTDNSLGLDPGVAMYTDGVYTSETSALYAASFGTERLEVLRGPQGTLYGRNAIGGAVNFVTERPTETWTLKGRFVGGNYDTREYGVLLGGPLTNWLRVSGMATDNARRGWKENVAGRDLRDGNSRFYRVQLEADLTDDITFWVKWNKSLWDYYGGGDTGHGLLPYNTCCQTSLIGVSPQRNYTGDNPAVRNPDEVNLNPNHLPKIRLQDTWHIASHLTWDLGPAIFKYIYGYQTYDWNSRHRDYDGTSRTDGIVQPMFGDIPFFEVEGANEFLEFVREDKQYYSHELQLISDTDDPLQWIVGLYYYNEEIEQPYTIYTPSNNMRNLCLSCDFEEHLFDFSNVVPHLNTTGGQFRGVTYFQLGKLKSKAYAAYGEIYYHFNDQWRLTAGIRGSYDRKHGEEYQDIFLDPLIYGIDYVLFTGGMVPECCAFLDSRRSRRLRDSWSAMSGRVVLDYMPDGDTLIYASISTGYKSGGFRLGSLNEADPVFDKEELISYEMGYKATLLDNRLMLNLAGYYYDYSDQHVFRPFRDVQAGITHQQVINAPESRMFGFELETQALLTDRLTLFGNYSYMDGEFLEFEGNFDTSFPEKGEQDLKDNDTSQTPEHKFSIGATYSVYTDDWGTFALTPRYSWVDEQTYDIFNESYAPSYHRTDVSLTWTHPEERYKVILYGKNLEDDVNYSSYGHGSNECLPTAAAIGGANGDCSLYRPPLGGFTNPPRTFGVEILLNYELGFMR